jgi:hypothetical protein
MDCEERMTDTQKKFAAAIAAVMQYLKAEEEMAAGSFATADTLPDARLGPKLWALNGRQTQMQLRSLMQLRTFSRMA